MNVYPGTPKIVAAAVVLILMVAAWVVVAGLAVAIWLDFHRLEAVGVACLAAGFTGGVWLTRWRTGQELAAEKAANGRWNLADTRYELDEIPTLRTPPGGSRSVDR